MENRIDRKDDKPLYQSKIHIERIRSLDQLNKETGKPITVLLDQSIRDFAASYGNLDGLNGLAGLPAGLLLH